MADCIDLKELVGHQWKVGYEESYEAERGQRGRADDPWLRIVPCDFGRLFPWGGQLLAASSDKRGVAARKLLAMDCCTLRQDGDDGVTVTFHVDHLDEVAAVMRPKRRRAPMSPEHRAKLLKAGEAHRFKPRSHGTNRSETALECDEKVA